MVTLTDWAAILSALAGVSATIFILLQLRHMEKHRGLEISMKLFDWAESERLHKAFRWIEDKFQFEDYRNTRRRWQTTMKQATIPTRSPPSLRKLVS